ncbi:Ig-like domain-containing protein [uncultured Prevotella sp.]|uniref:Ig-like domain-containing protein n=1 Tax=uncultured Prevotella sp. TaxID=159272 RepID=UPI002803CA14|nr:Ig-like domain-containing protein [uncultured Prevotella sp.]
MKHYLRFLITMLLLILFGGGSFGQTWQKVEFKDLTSDDVFVIAEIHDLKSSYAMSNDNGASKAPSAVSIKLSEDGTTITSAVDDVDKIKWNVGKVGNSYVFYPNGNKTKWLYCTNNNNGVRVGTNDNKTFVLKTDNSNNYLGLFNTTQKRYVGVYSGSDWRCYTSVNSNITGQQIAFYKLDTRKSTTLDFATPSGSVNLGEAFTLPELTLKAGEETLTGKTFTYSSSAPEVASIDEKGLVTVNAIGKTVFTASYGGDKVYSESEAKFELIVEDPYKVSLFYESFDKANGTGGNDGEFNSGDTTWDSSITDNPGWKLSGSAYLAKQCVRIGKSKDGLSSLTSPAISVKGDATLTFKAGAWKGKKTIGAVKITVSNGLLSYNGKEKHTQTIDIPDGAWGDFEMSIKGATDGLTLKFENVNASKNMFYLDEVKVTQPKVTEETVVLDETSEKISDVIKANADKVVTVTLKRSISKDYLNTVCLPFALSADQVAEVFGVGSVVSDYTSVTGTVMNFTPVTEMVANHPYIVKATETFDTKNIAGVTLKTIVNDENRVGFTNAERSFLAYVGSPSIYTFTSVAGDQLFLGKDGKLYCPTENGKLKGMRAYFKVLGGTGNEAKVDIGGGLSSIDKLMNGEAMTGKVYNLNGQYVGNTLDGLAKGLYIMNGKKYIVK